MQAKVNLAPSVIHLTGRLGQGAIWRHILPDNDNIYHQRVGEILILWCVALKFLGLFMALWQGWKSAMKHVPVIYFNHARLKVGLYGR